VSKYPLLAEHWWDGRTKKNVVDWSLHGNISTHTVNKSNPTPSHTTPKKTVSSLASAPSNRKQSESQRNRHPRSPRGQRGRPGMIRIDGNCSPTREPSLTCIIHQHSNGGNSPILRLTHKRSFSVDALLFFPLLSGKRLHSYLENGPVEIYSWFTHWKWWFSHSFFVCLPEGNSADSTKDSVKALGMLGMRWDRGRPGFFVAIFMGISRAIYWDLPYINERYGRYEIWD